MKKLLFTTVLLLVLMSSKSNAQSVMIAEMWSTPGYGRGNNVSPVTAVAILGIPTVIAVIYFIRKDNKKDSPKRGNEWCIHAYAPDTPISNSELFQYSLKNRSEEIPIQYTIRKIFKTVRISVSSAEPQAGRKSEI